MEHVVSSHYGHIKEGLYVQRRWNGPRDEVAMDPDVLQRLHGTKHAAQRAAQARVLHRPNLQLVQGVEGMR